MVIVNVESGELQFYHHGNHDYGNDAKHVSDLNAWPHSVDDDDNDDQNHDDDGDDEDKCR